MSILNARGGPIGKAGPALNKYKPPVGFRAFEIFYLVETTDPSYPTTVSMLRQGSNVCSIRVSNSLQDFQSVSVVTITGGISWSFIVQGIVEASGSASQSGISVNKTNWNPASGNAEYSFGGRGSGEGFSVRTIIEVEEDKIVSLPGFYSDGSYNGANYLREIT